MNVGVVARGAPFPGASATDPSLPPPLCSDPRFGRNSELPSEDPLLAGEYGKTYVKACQEGSDPKYLKMIAGLKVCVCVCAMNLMCLMCACAAQQKQERRTAAPVRSRADARSTSATTPAQHYDAYSVETNRMSFNAEITTFDLWDTYLPQVKLSDRPLWRSRGKGHAGLAVPRPPLYNMT